MKNRNQSEEESLYLYHQYRWLTSALRWILDTVEMEVGGSAGCIFSETLPHSIWNIHISRIIKHVSSLNVTISKRCAIPISMGIDNERVERTWWINKRIILRQWEEGRFLMVPSSAHLDNSPQTCIINTRKWRIWTTKRTKRIPLISDLPLECIHSSLLYYPLELGRLPLCRFNRWITIKNCVYIWPPLGIPLDSYSNSIGWISFLH